MGALAVVKSAVKREVDEYGSWTTDTRYYWKLTHHIVRYNHQYGANTRAPPNNIHTVNERM